MGAGDSVPAPFRLWSYNLNYCSPRYHLNPFFRWTLPVFCRHLTLHHLCLFWFASWHINLLHLNKPTFHTTEEITRTAVKQFLSSLLAPLCAQWVGIVVGMERPASIAVAVRSFWCSAEGRDIQNLEATANMLCLSVSIILTALTRR